MAAIASYSERAGAIANPWIGGLHALPGSEGFYRKVGMMDCGADETKENLTYFEWYRRRPSLLDELAL
jgi:hypothetical protein